MPVSGRIQDSRIREVDIEPEGQDLSTENARRARTRVDEVVVERPGSPRPFAYPALARCQRCSATTAQRELQERTAQSLAGDELTDEGVSANVSSGTSGSDRSLSPLCGKQSWPDRVEPDELDPDGTGALLRRFPDDGHPLPGEASRAAELREQRVRHEEADHLAPIGDELVAYAG